MKVHQLKCKNTTEINECTEKIIYKKKNTKKTNMNNFTGGT